jgi:hypothetical protein
MSTRLAGLALVVAIVLAVWVLCAPGTGVDGRGALALVLALVAVLVPVRRSVR